ncbi:unnamed protein product [Amoebophrya sp. A25]|nr:unnamed protein product [Amoebophrya sp. A25]|eukprot:GSA25T00021122001.1
MEKRKRGVVTILGRCYGNVKRLLTLLRTKFECTCEIYDAEGAVSAGTTGRTDGAGKDGEL